jgi:hypothetical protein
VAFEIPSNLEPIRQPRPPPREDRRTLFPGNNMNL